MTIYRFAGFWRRFVAYMIDGFILTIVFIILMIVAAVAYFAGAMSGNNQVWLSQLTDPERLAALSLWISLFSILLNIAYFTYFHGSTGRTPGKMLLGLQVVSVAGAPISFGIAFLRSVGYLVSSIVFCLGFIWIGFDKKKQGWHDKMAGTVVIIRAPEGSTAGISIPDPAAPAQSSVAIDDTSVDISQPEVKKPETPSAEDVTGVDGQKIP
jgi:uncharacterized RDD family membrane protein YckC